MLSPKQVPIQDQKVARPPKDKRGSNLPYRDRGPVDDKDPLDGLSRFRVFGMTARILVDAARVAYGEDPEFEHNSHFGEFPLSSQMTAERLHSAVQCFGLRVLC